MKLRALIARNCKIYFRDKGVFVTSMIAPVIILFLYVAFLGSVYSDSLVNSVGKFGITVEKQVVDGFAGGWLISSLIAVSAVSIAFTANMVMVQDKMTGRIDDFAAAPLSKSILALGYYLSTLLITLGICFLALGIGFIYLAIVGWYLTAADVFLTILDTVILVIFGTALSSLVLSAVNSQGGVTAVQLIVSAAYGFLCGAYMPIGSLVDGIRHVLMFLPGTYGTALLHEHLMGGAVNAISEISEVQEAVRSGFDCTPDFFGNDVPVWACYLIIGITALLLVGGFVLLCVLAGKRKKHKRI